MSTGTLKRTFLILAIATFAVVKASYAIDADRAAAVGRTELVPYQNECDLALTFNGQLPSKRMFGDGFQLVQGVTPLNDLIAEDLYATLLPAAKADENKFRDIRFDILPLMTTSLDLVDEFVYWQVEKKKPGVSVSLSRTQVLLLRMHLERLLKSVGKIYHEKMAFENLELRILSEEESQNHPGEVYYHYDAGDLRFTETLLGVTTFVRANGQVFFAPKHVPLLFTADDGSALFEDHPMTEHGHPRTKGRRLLLVGTIRIDDE